MKNTFLPLLRFLSLVLILSCSARVADSAKSSSAGRKTSKGGTSTKGEDDRNATCQALAKQTGGGLQSLLGMFGTTGAAAGAYVATQDQKAAALNYTDQCSHPRYGRINKNILLTKWNSGGNFIYPGTKWCGAGNASSGTGDYGSAEKTDICCEIHDNATDYMLANENHSRHPGLKNPHPYTVTHCNDDMKLFNCLYNDNSTDVSLQFGQAFFDAMQVPCFIETYPKVCTRSSSSFFSTTCLEYKLNKTAPKEWQLFYAPNFYDAYVTKWYPNDRDVKREPAQGPLDNWTLFCNAEDPELNCGDYEFLKSKTNGMAI